MARTDTLTNYLTDVASAIKTKKGDNTPILASNFDTEIANLPSGGGGTLDWSALGYSGTPPTTQDGYDYAKSIYDNWSTSENLRRKFRTDRMMVFMPMVDTSITTNMSEMFSGCCSLTYVPNLDTSKVENMSSMFNSCYGLHTTPNFNTSKVQTMTGMFQNCNSLKNVYLYDTSSIVSNTGMNNMFYGCPILTDESLDNILRMCINATSYNGTKSLAILGFSSAFYESSRIQALPHYQDFITAGWTIGY